MAKNSNYQFNSILIMPFDPGEDSVSSDRYPLKYHYTSPEALLSILEKNEIFFTDIRYMNDKSEDIYLVKLILDTLDEYRKDYPIVEEVVNELFKNHPLSELQNLNVINIDYSTPLKFIPRRKFVFCTTIGADSLNMWNYYVHNGKYQGYNIGFNAWKLLKSLDSNAPKTIDPYSVVYGKVLYSAKKQKETILRLFDSIEYNKTIKNDVDFYVMHLREYIDTYGAFFKNPSFSQEKEYRICIGIDDERLKREKPHVSSTINTRMRCSYRVSNGLIVPYIAVRYNKDSISRITISPMTEFQIAKESLREVLDDYHYDGVQIHKSKIPVRF